MKRIYSRFRITLMAFTLGLAAVYMWNGLSIAWSEVPVELPHAGSTDVLVVFPADEKTIGDTGSGGGGTLDFLPPDQADIDRAIVGDRNLSLYDRGGHQGCGLVRIGPESRRCDRLMRNARNFIWNHWQQKKRGYVVIKRASCDAESDAHIFIEPDEKGQWRIAWTWERIFGMYLLDNGSAENRIDILSDIHHIEWKFATDDDWDFRPGAKYLQFTDDEGDDLTL